MDRTAAKALTPEEARNYKSAQDLDEGYCRALFAVGRRIGRLKGSVEDSCAFIRAFNDSVSERNGGVTGDVQQFRRMQEEHSLSEKDCFTLALIMVLAERNANLPFMGKKLMILLSRAGLMEATLMLMNQALQQNKKKPGSLNMPELSYARAHLKELAYGADAANHEAMVLQGKIANATGHQETAIALWTKAMDGAIAASETAKKVRERPSVPVFADGLELLSPWIELTLIHHERTVTQGKMELDKCRWAMEIGFAQDDPTSFYHAASFFRTVDQHGNHIVTSDWFYNITKAAASGHARAAHELGVFYAQSGWKYVEDEPPDHVKPTSFDSYPGIMSFMGSRMHRIAQFFGLKPFQRPQPKDQIFQTAIFPHSAKDRFILSRYWLGEATKLTYAPSWLFLAQMYLQETLWANATAPKSALQLNKSRYTYASKAEFEAGKPIRAHSGNDWDQPPAADPPNHSYSLKDARVAVREVFYMYKAHQIKDQMTGSYAAQRRQGFVGEVRDENSLIGERRFREYPSYIRKWFRLPSIRESYENEIDSLYAEAKAICDDHGWDMHDEDGGLLYRCKRDLPEVRNQSQPSSAAMAS